eukprot:TRINITY_DN3679_c0_g1_i3.p1 TRINITY_DN3679_c0_g1~~TRINITY_DN3679_c0_g1_i3.p1  ORF type:complete len:474 (-),score=47.05 TRINITY_DN3679_c0_g1_i3:728-2149(-)
MEGEGESGGGGRRLRDSEVARQLQRELDGVSSPSSSQSSSSLSDSMVARLLQDEDHLHQDGRRRSPLLSDSDFARRLQAEMDTPARTTPPRQLHGPAHTSSSSYRFTARPVAFVGRLELECGNKIILPASMLQQLETQMEEGALLFEIVNAAFAHIVDVPRLYCGVLDFTSPHSSTAVMPQWLLEALGVASGDEIVLKQAFLPRATRVKLQPELPEFMDLPNPKALLEQQLSYSYCTLTMGQDIAIEVREQTPSLGASNESDSNVRYTIKVLECEPSDSVCLIETEVTLDLVPSDLPRRHIHTQLSLSEKQTGDVAADDYAYYQFVTPPDMREESFVFIVEAITGDPDLYIDQKTRKPSRREHTWLSTSTGVEQIVIMKDDPKRIKGPYWIGVRGHKKAAHFTITVMKVVNSLEEPEVPLSTPDAGQVINSASSDIPPGPGHSRCANCLRWVPEHNFARHEGFCKRSNYRCCR